MVNQCFKISRGPSFLTTLHRTKVFINQSLSSNPLLFGPATGASPWNLLKCIILGHTKSTKNLHFSKVFPRQLYAHLKLFQITVFSQCMSLPGFWPLVGFLLCLGSKDCALPAVLRPPYTKLQGRETQVIYQLNCLSYRNALILLSLFPFLTFLSLSQKCFVCVYIYVF